MSNKYFWSDLHMGHDLVAEQRGFDSTADHDEYVLQTLAETISKRDILFLLGDLWIKGSMDTHLENLAKIPGRAALIFGNHCPGHPMNPRYMAHQRRYAEVFDFTGTQSAMKIGDHYVALSHFPYRGDHSGKEDRHTMWRPHDKGGWVIHGHVHQEWKVRDRQINVGVDQWDKPASLHEIAALLE